MSSLLFRMDADRKRKGKLICVFPNHTPVGGPEETGAPRLGNPTREMAAYEFAPEAEKFAYNSDDPP